MIVLHTEDIPLDILLPLHVHSFRNQLLVAVVNQSFPIEIHKLVFRNPLQSFNAEPSSPPHTDLYLVENSQTHALLSNPDASAHRSRTGVDISANSEPSKKCQL
jgi:hypothetical protein